VADDRALQVHVVGGCLLGRDAGLSRGRDAVPAAGHPRLHGVVLLGIPRQGARRHRLPLRFLPAAIIGYTAPVVMPCAAPKKGPLPAGGRELGGAMSRVMAVIAMLAALLAMIAAVPAANAADDKLVLQLHGPAQFEFAGYYAALWQGFYRDAGLEVEIKPGPDRGQPAIDPVREITEGRAQFATGTTELVIRTAQGLPLLLLA